MAKPMGERQPFVLLDDARPARGGGADAAPNAADAQLFADPAQVFVARRPAEVATVLEAADTARRETGGTLAGYIAYEAGLALESKLAHRADARTGAAGPLVWLGLFHGKQDIAAHDVPQWLAANAGDSGDAAHTGIGPLEPQVSQAAYTEAFTAMQDAIAAGDIYQANLTFPLAGSYRGDPVALYAALRGGSEAGYGGLVFDGSHWLLSFSPELFVSLKDGSAKAKPMKGTRPRGATPEQDRALAADLAASQKDRAENLMIVDLLRNDISRVAQAGSVEVAAPFSVETYPTVHQMVSTVRATLRDDAGPVDLVRAMFPCGSITGAPKLRAMELIDTIERDARGPYCGAIGRIDANGDAAFNVAIRTLRLTPVENARGTAVLGVGSAIVADSDADSEWRESLLKGGFARQSTPDLRAAQFDLIETMRFAPDSGIALLEAHLARLKGSATTLGFAFDRHAVRNQIHALCFELENPAKLRLLVARSGATSLTVSELPGPASGPAPGPLTCIALPLPVDQGDWRLRHKTTDRAFYEAARGAAEDAGAREAIFVAPDGSVTEGSWTNVFVEREGILLTPPATLGLLPGVQRAHLLDSGAAREARLTLDDLADGFAIGNAVRGLMKATFLP